MERKRRVLNPMGKILESMAQGKGNLFIPRQAELVKTGIDRESMESHHIHLYPEIFLQLRGSSLFSFNEGDYTLKEGDIALIPPMTTHPDRVGGSDHDFLNLVIMVTPHQVNCHLARAQGGLPRVNESIWKRTGRGEKIIALEKVIIDLFVRGESNLILPLLRTIYFYLEDLFLKGDTSDFPLSDKVARACSVIRVEIANPRLNGEYLANQLGCSRDYLSHLFNREMGERLSSHIREERVNRAKNLLSHTGLNCSETAWACGFSQAAYFNRVFKEQTGLTPREYKKRNPSSLN